MGKNMTKKILVQFDGSNFFNKVKTITPEIHLTYYDYAGLAKLIAKNTSVEVIYYVGEIKQYPGQNKSQVLYANQQKLFTVLRHQEIQIKLGYLLMSDGKFHEKGVDVQIAVDMVRGAIKHEYDLCYLISSDTDLLPAIQTAKEEKRSVIYVGFEDFMSRALIKNCSSYQTLTKEQIRQFA